MDKKLRLVGLVDSGADEILLDLPLAELLGIDLKSCEEDVRTGFTKSTASLALPKTPSVISAKGFYGRLGGNSVYNVNIINTLFVKILDTIFLFGILNA